MIKYWLLLLLIHANCSLAIKSPASNKKWLTLDGQPPVVVARGGFSGIFPESSEFATDLAHSSLPNVVMLCNLQLTKDEIGICQPDVRIDNTTNIDMIYPNQKKTYKVNGKDVTGWFSVDFTYQQLLENVTVMQNILTRTNVFDNQLPISTVDDILHSKYQAYWLNVQYDMFYTEHKLNMASYIQNQRAFRLLNYISSPEISLLKALKEKVSNRIKLIFVFLDENAVEPSTKQTYGSILKDLATIKSFASGIVVPKNFIWPVDKTNYLEKNATSLVLDAHKAGLEVYASGFANDLLTVYDYHYDPISEYLNFIDNPQFSVDGMITDFPSTASSAIACFANYSGMNIPKKGKPTIISHNGASGVYAGCTDLAYQQALQDGADIIDCSVQMSKDGVAFCSISADLTQDTTAMLTFISRSSTVPEIQKTAGIFSFDLTWAEIQTLKPLLTSPLRNNLFPRNPANANAGKLMTLAEFLEFAKTKAASGILINIDNAAYLAAKEGLDIVTGVTTALSNATFDKQSTQQVLIQSDDTSVLSKFQNVPAYKRVLYLKDEISDAPMKPVEEIKKYAEAVNLPRFSIIPTTDGGFAETTTNVVKEMHKANLTVYVSVLRNEFGALAFDFLSDPTVEVATYIAGIEVDGIITEYPATANRYLNSICSNLDYDLAFTILPVEPPLLLQFISPDMQPPAAAPKPVLDVADLVDPPLATTKAESDSPSPTAAHKSGSSPRLANVNHLGLTLLATLLLGSLLQGY